tara:strand:+ start:3477 stop:3890 length:414 start_codon:yes stop_codon:yes gene_type:complete
MYIIILATLLTTTQVAQEPTWDKPNDPYTIDYEFNNELGIIKLIITPKKGYKWEDAYNARLKLKKNKNAVLTKRTFTNKDKDFVRQENNVVVLIPYYLKRPKDTVVKGKLNFLICNDKVCKPQKNVELLIHIYMDGC